VKAKLSKWLILAAAGVILFGGWAVSPVLAQDPTPSDDEVNEIAEDLYCPVCENIPLDTCGTEACEQWRGVIRDKLSEGWTEEQIKNYFVAQYGDRVLAEPPRRGFNWLIYVVPPAVFAAGVYLLYQGFLSWRKLEEEPAAPEANDDQGAEEYLSRVEEELRKRQ
jgi:cytochrome c-type biogenesis protein CcmH